MNLSLADRRTLRIIAQNIILSSHLRDGDVVDPSTQKRVIPDARTDRLIDAGLAEWSWDESYQEYRLVLTDVGAREQHSESP